MIELAQLYYRHLFLGKRLLPAPPTPPLPNPLLSRTRLNYIYKIPRFLLFRSPPPPPPLPLSALLLMVVVRLFDCALRVVLKEVGQYERDFPYLPGDLRVQLAHVLARRGLLHSRNMTLVGACPDCLVGVLISWVVS